MKLQKFVKFDEKDSQSLLKVKIIGKLEIIVITQANIQVQPIVYIISNLICLMKFL